MDSTDPASHSARPFTRAKGTGAPFHATETVRRRGIVGALVALLVVAGLTGTASAASGGAPANDARYQDQWGLQRVGAPYAWSRSTGKDVLIAVVDTGVDLSHPDLAGQLVPGRDFVDGDDEPGDESGHGTLLAGIAAAASGNRVGIASVAPGAQILPVRVLSGNGIGRPATTAEGIRWAVDTARARGQRLVVNLSLDWEPAPDGADLIRDVAPAGFAEDPVIDAAIKDAARAGAVVVVAAGNEGVDHTPYDATIPGVLVVGASDRSDQRTAFSSHGQGLDLLAPGVDILSTYWTPRTGSTYGVAKGTSVAVPFVSGTAALLMASGRSNAEAAATILGTTSDLGAPGWDPETGQGLLDTAAALGAPRTGTPRLPGAAPATRPSPAPSSRTPGASPAPDAQPLPDGLPALPEPAPCNLGSCGPASFGPAPSVLPSLSPPVPTSFTMALERASGLQIPAPETVPPGLGLGLAATTALVALLALTASRRSLRTCANARSATRLGRIRLGGDALWYQDRAPHERLQRPVPPGYRPPPSSWSDRGYGRSRYAARPFGRFRMQAIPRRQAFERGRRGRRGRLR